MTAPIVSFRNVSYRIGRRPVLDGVSFDVERGETLVLLGRSGSGKTTALKLINGLIHPTEGDVRVEGRSTRDWDAVRLKRHIGYVIQDVGLFPHWTVARNVGLVPGLEGWDRRRTGEKVGELLERMGLPPGEFGERYPRELSGGQRQRVGVARALAGDPPLLLFDEPFGALDPVTRFEAQRLFLELRRSLHKTAVFVTHDVREALRLASRIALLANGRLEAIAPPLEFRRGETAEAREFLACLEPKEEEC